MKGSKQSEDYRADWRNMELAIIEIAAKGLRPGIMSMYPIFDALQPEARAKYSPQRFKNMLNDVRRAVPGVDWVRYNNLHSHYAKSHYLAALLRVKHGMDIPEDMMKWLNDEVAADTSVTTHDPEPVVEVKPEQPETIEPTPTDGYRERLSVWLRTQKMGRMERLKHEERRLWESLARNERQQEALS